MLSVSVPLPMVFLQAFSALSDAHAIVTSTEARTLARPLEAMHCVR